MTTPPVVSPVILGNGVFEPSRDFQSRISTRSTFEAREKPQQVTVMLKGFEFNAALSLHVWTSNTSSIGDQKIELPESDYTIAANIFDHDDYQSLTLQAVSIGNNTGVTLTLTGQNPNQEPGRWVAPTLSEPSYSSGNRPSSGVLAETGLTWVEHSTSSSPGMNAKKSLNGSAGCMVVPSNRVLNLRALVSAFSKLSTQQIEKGIQDLIDLLDFRAGDSDLEDDADLEPEIEEESAQLI